MWRTELVGWSVLRELKGSCLSALEIACLGGPVAGQEQLWGDASPHCES